MTLPCVVWDMGGILYRYFTELMVEVGQERGWPVDRLPLGPTGPGDDPLYRRMLEGEFDEPEYLRRVVGALAAVGIDFDPPRDLDWSDRERPEAWAAILRLHEAGFRQALLTNDASKWLGEQWWETWEPARWFEGVVDVTTLGVRKPDPEPYRAAARALGVPPQACLFVDDMPVNCRGAEAVGMASLWFDVTDASGSIARLYDALGLE